MNIQSGGGRDEHDGAGSDGDGQEESDDEADGGRSTDKNSACSHE